MPPIRLRHIQRFRDRAGRLRLYLRIPGLPRVALPAPEDGTIHVHRGFLLNHSESPDPFYRYGAFLLFLEAPIHTDAIHSRVSETLY